MLNMTMTTRSSTSQRARPERGISLVELMIGLAVGLMVTAGAISLFATNVSQSRRVVANARVEQDLRNIADLITRDLRRAGYWGNAIKGTLAVGAGAAAASNPYASVAPASSATDGQIVYSFSRDADNASDALKDAKSDAEIFGFRRNSEDGTVEMQTGKDTWKKLNDPNYTTITALSLSDASPASIPLGYRCPTNCAAGTPNCPEVKVRRYDLVLTGRSVLDSTVVRTLRTSVRLRNDQMSGQCPP
ncbi:PilW family protein [Paucibacter soli]|uniref:PilW family protein n=1 Tax=Paucibacter soli TaxID=3133433 RepID=UPI003098238D